MQLKWEDKGIKTPLARARGLGSARGDAVGHWLAERVSALATVPLSVWLVLSLSHIAGAPHTVFKTWLAQPVHGIPALLFILFSFYHAALGIQVVIEDYVHHEGTKFAAIIGVKLGLFAMAVACVFAILKIAFAG